MHVSFSIEFRFETKIDCFVTRIYTFVLTFSEFIMTPYLLWKELHIHISSVIFVISMMLMNIFVCPYSFLDRTVIPLHLYHFIFCFEFYYPIVDIILSHLYLLFLRSRKTSTKPCDKNAKSPHYYHLGVASKICCQKYCCI